MKWDLTPSLVDSVAAAAEPELVCSPSRSIVDDGPAAVMFSPSDVKSSSASAEVSSAGVNSKLQSSPKASSSPAEFVTTIAGQENSGKAEGASVTVTLVVVQEVEVIVVVPLKVPVQTIACLGMSAGAAVGDESKALASMGVSESSPRSTCSVSLQSSPSSREALFRDWVKVVALQTNSGIWGPPSSSASKTVTVCLRVDMMIVEVVSI